MYRQPLKTRSFRSEDFRPRVRPRLDMAPRQSGPSSGFSPNDRIRLITNAFNLHKQAPANELSIHEYGLIVIPSYKNVPDRVLNKPAVKQAIRKLINDDILLKISHGKSASGSVIIDLTMENIFSLHAFEDSESQQSTSTSEKSRFSFIDVPIESNLVQRLNVDIFIDFKKSHSLQSGESCLKILSDILHHQLLLRMIKYGSVYYLLHEMSNINLPSTGLDLISEHIMGITLSGTKRNERGQDLVVVNCSHCYITQSHRLINLLVTFMEGEPTDIEDLGGESQAEMRSLRGDEEWFFTFCSILEGFKCKAHILGDCLNIRFSKSSFFDPVGSDALPVKFYQDLGIHLMYPNLPNFASPSPKYPYIPFELCTLLPGQKVPIFRLSTAARNHLTTINKQKPDFTRDTSFRARTEIATMCQPQLTAFGLSLSEQPLEAMGRILQRPRLQFRDRQIQPFRDFWESGAFCQSVELVGNWCVINTVTVDQRIQRKFFQDFGSFSTRFGLRMSEPYQLDQPKETLSDPNALEQLINKCLHISKGRLRFLMFIIDSSSTALNRMIHLSFDKYQNITAGCLRKENILKQRQHRAIFRTLVHKLNARLGGTNVTYDVQALNDINLEASELMILGLDVTHPDNELKGVSIVGCAYTYSSDLFKHRSVVWPQTARKEFIDRMGQLFNRLLQEFCDENNGRLPKHIIVYRDGVSHEDFNRVQNVEISGVSLEIERFCRNTGKPKPNLSFIVAQKRHTMRFFQVADSDRVSNPPGGTLINEEVIANSGREFYLFSHSSPQATARPIHYHVLQKSLSIDVLHKLTYFLCFNFGKCSGSLSMPSSLKYAHNAAYDARNRVINSREFSENKFYTNKFFC